jgi:hypothetical protein
VTARSPGLDLDAEMMLLASRLEVERLRGALSKIAAPYRGPNPLRRQQIAASALSAAPPPDLGPLKELVAATGRLRGPSPLTTGVVAARAALLDTVTDMLAEGYSWEEIGREIGWQPKAAREHWLDSVKNPRPWLYRKVHGEPVASGEYDVAVDTIAAGPAIRGAHWTGMNWRTAAAFTPSQIYAWRPTEKAPPIEPEE